MKKQTKIIKDQKQTRTTIPAQLVEKAGVKNGSHVAEWEFKNGKLKAVVKENDDSNLTLLKGGDQKNDKRNKRNK